MSQSLKPVVVAIDMGYGHLRPAHAIAERLGVPVFDVDRAPLATAQDAALWMWVRRYYEGLSRASQYPMIGPPMRSVLNAVTDIGSLYSVRDQSKPNVGTFVLEQLMQDADYDVRIAARAAASTQRRWILHSSRR